MAGNMNSSSNPGQDFYSALVNIGANMEKSASANDAEGIIDALRNSDFTEEQLEALAGELDASMQKTADPTETQMLDNDDESEKKASVSPESMLEKLASAMTPEGEEPGIGVTVLTKLASALMDIATENDIDLAIEEDCDAFCKMAAESIISSVTDDVETEFNGITDEDMELMAAEYNETYEKLAAEGYTTADYVYAQTGDEHIAGFVGENAEKLAAVSGLNPLIVADDIISQIEQQLPEE